jgi:hypothetical protein
VQELSDSPKIVEFLLERGLDPVHATSCGVKALDQTRIAYPLWNGQWKVRDVLTKDMTVIKYGSTDKPLPAVFGRLSQTLDRENAFHIHLTEGETDALALSQVLENNNLNGMTVAVPGVNGISHAVRLLKPMLGPNIHITIYPDGDRAGNDLATAASELGAYVVQLPKGQDLCEFLGPLDSHHQWQALQLLRHHAATYVPAKAPVSQSKSTVHKRGTNIPPGVHAYFQRLVEESVGDCGYSEVEKVCCPWHEDPNPSLSIDWTRCIWYCHGCQLGGGVKKWQALAREKAMTM